MQNNIVAKYCRTNYFGFQFCFFFNKNETVATKTKLSGLFCDLKQNVVLLQNLNNSFITYAGINGYSNDEFENCLNRRQNLILG